MDVQNDVYVYTAHLNLDEGESMYSDLSYHSSSYQDIYFYGILGLDHAGKMSNHNFSS